MLTRMDTLPTPPYPSLPLPTPPYPSLPLPTPPYPSLPLPTPPYPSLPLPTPRFSLTSFHRIPHHPPNRNSCGTLSYEGRRG